MKNISEMPVMGIGTWQSDPEKLYNAIVTAVEYGYRHIDCAYIYDNEKIVGEAIDHLIKKGTVTRSELWITSKLWNSFHKRSQILGAIETSLTDLRTDYLDLYLVHWPIALKEGVKFPTTRNDFYTLEQVPLAETWSGMEDCFESKLSRNIGVSNFSMKKLDGLAATWNVPAQVNQVEMNPYLQQKELLKYCQSNDIKVTAYSPLGKGNVARQNNLNLFEDAVIKDVAQRNKCTVSQVLLKWAIQKNITVIPKSVTPERIRENFDALKVTLAPADMALIDTLDKHNRISYGGVFMVDNGPYTYENIWDEQK